MIPDKDKIKELVELYDITLRQLRSYTEYKTYSDITETLEKEIYKYEKFVPLEVLSRLIHDLKAKYGVIYE